MLNVLLNSDSIYIYSMWDMRCVILNFVTLLGQQLDNQIVEKPQIQNCNVSIQHYSL